MSTMSVLLAVTKIAFPLGRKAISYSRGGWTENERKAFGGDLKAAAVQLVVLADQSTDDYAEGHPARVAGDLLGAVVVCADDGWQLDDVTTLSELLVESGEKLLAWVEDQGVGIDLPVLTRSRVATSPTPKAHFASKTVRKARSGGLTPRTPLRPSASPSAPTPKPPHFGDELKLDLSEKPSFSANRPLSNRPAVPLSGWPKPPRPTAPVVDIEDPDDTDDNAAEETVVAPEPGEVEASTRPMVAVIFHVEAERIDGQDTWEPLTESNIVEWASSVLAEVRALGGPCRIQVPDVVAKRFMANVHWENFIRDFEALGGSLDARSHKGGVEGAVAGQDALGRAGATKTGVLGSLTPEEVDSFADQDTFWLLTGIGLPGHGAGEDELHRLVGFSAVGDDGVYQTHEGVANSLAKLLDLSRYDSQVFDVVRAQAQRPKGVTSGSVLYSPARHVGESGEQAAQPFLPDLQKTVALGADFEIVDLVDMFDAWKEIGQPAPVEVTMSATG